MKIVLLCFVLLMSGVCTAASNPPPPSSWEGIQKQNSKAAQAAQNPTSEQKGTEQNPIFVKSLPSPQSESDTRHKEYEHHEKPTLERFMGWGTLALAIFTGLLFVFTAGLWWVTYRLSRDAREEGKSRSREMAESIREANRAAKAMESLAVSAAANSEAAIESVLVLKDRTAQQMRAYLMVTIGGGTYQEREKNLMFEVRPQLVNSGNTPAHKMTYWAKAKIMNFPLPDNFIFEPPAEIVQHSMLIGPHQSIELNARVDDFVADDEVESIKRGNGKRVYIWGMITYTDAFDLVHTTKFCHSLVWLGPDDKLIVNGTYSHNHNEAT
jgi:hypothetical protein